MVATCIGNSKPVYFLKMNPKGWTVASLPKFKKTAQDVMLQSSLSQEQLSTMPWSQRHEDLHFCALKLQEKRWEDETGVKPEQSFFTLMVPIHNEENSLPSFLRTLMLADIPASIELKIILISNACTDSSQAIIHEFLLSLGTVEEYPLECGWKDEGLKPTCQIVKLNHTTFMHVDSQTPGKANALSIGNSIARRDNCIISMSVDANNYLEPDAIRIMFAHAHRVLHGKLEARATVLISGNEQLERQNSRFTSVIEQSTKVQSHLVENINGYVLGCFMAWDTEWMHSIGGPPALALEDYALGVLARAQHYTIERAQGANIWIYAVNNVSGLLDTRARYVRGMLQLVEFVHRDPPILGILEKEAYYMRHVRARLRHLFLKSKQRPQDFPRYVATFLLWEYALLKGKQEYRQNPTNQSWKKVASTY